MNADQIERMFIDSFKEEGVNEKFVEALRAKARLNGKKPEQLIVDIVVDGKYANIKKMETIDGLVKEEKKEEKKEGKTEEKSIDKVPNHIWEAKDRRMCRMTSLTHALKTV